jgi:hypothetical protein
MATNNAQPQRQAQPQAEGQAGTAARTPANPRQMEGQSAPVAPQQGTAALRDWASI